MNGHLVLKAYDKLVELIADEDVLELARLRLPDAFRPGRGAAERSWRILRDENGWRATVNGDHLGTRPNADFALETALGDMELWVAEHVQEFVCVHAGTVAVDGRAIVLPGRTFSGKTRMVQALCLAGARYYSDEFALIDREGMVHPYPRPLSLRDGASGAARAHPAEIGLTIGQAPARIALVALLQFDAGSGWHVKPLSRAWTIMGLLENTIPAQSRPLDSLRAAELITKDGYGFVGTRGEAEEAARLLLGLLEPS